MGCEDGRSGCRSLTGSVGFFSTLELPKKPGGCLFRRCPADGKPQMDDLLNEFLTESAESLAVLDVELVKFEQNPQDTAILQNIFRLVHTIKGTCGFLGLPRLESVAHAGENVLGNFREGTLEVTPGAPRRREKRPEGRSCAARGPWGAMIA